MSGPRILAVVAAVALVLLVLALREDRDGTVRRGLEVSEDAFAAAESALESLEPDYEYLQQRGLVLALKEEHDGLRTQLAALRSRGVDLADDRTLPSVERLERLRALAHETDLLTAGALGLADKLAARAGFVRDSNPLLIRARAQRDALNALPDVDDATAARIADLGRNFAELENQVGSTMLLLQQNPGQGKIMAAVTLKGLRTLLDQQQALVDAADG